MITHRLGRFGLGRFAAALTTAGLGLLALPVAPAAGASFAVSNTNDSGPGSLRQAVTDASSAGGVDTVVIPSGLGTITLSSTIEFSGTDLTTVQGNNNTVSFAAGTAFNSNFGYPYTLDGLTINANQGANTLNGSLTISGSTLNVSSEGANTLDGSLTISGSTINSDDDGANTNNGTMTVTDSTINIGPGLGLNTNAGALTLTNSKIISSSDGDGVNTFSGNISIAGSEIAVGGYGDNSGVGDIAISASSVIGQGPNTRRGVADSEGPVTLVNSTVTGFSGEGVDASNVTLVYSDIVENGTDESVNVSAYDLHTFGSILTSSVDDCSITNTTTRSGYNFSNDSTCGLTGTGDTQNGGSPGLGSLADNGGNSRTFLPQTGSPLINAIPLSSCQADGASGVTTDQRGLPRPASTGCEIGSVELQPTPPPTSTTTAPGSTTSTSASQSANAVVAVPRFTG